MRRTHNWDNSYQGMWVPNGHGSIFRGMDMDALLAKRCTDNLEASRKKNVMSVAQAAYNELSKIRDKHLTEYNQIMLKTLEDLIDDIDIQQIILSRSPAGLNSRCQLGQSNKFNATKKLLPDLLNEYNRTFSDISKPFNDTCQALLKSNSTSEVQAKKALFLSQMHFLNPYFDYPDGTNGKLPTSQITVKQTLLDIANTVAEQVTVSFEQQELARIQEQERLRIEEEEALIKAQEDEGKSQEPEIEDDIPQQPLGLPQNEDELLAMIQQLRASLQKKDDIIGQQAGQLQEKDQVIDQQAGQLDQQAEQIGGLSERLELSQKLNQELRQDKSDLREHVSDLREVNLEKTAKLKQSEEIIAKQKSEYDLLKDQFDSIVGLGVHQQDEGSQLSGASNDLSIGSFELVGDQ